LVAAARGRVLEIGGGLGRNLPHYRDVESVAFVEPDPGLRSGLMQRVAAAPVPVVVHDIGVDELDSLPAGAFDAVVCVLVLCGIERLDDALRAMARRLTPDGRLLFLEHVRGGGVRAAAQRAAAPTWRRVFGGCRPDRDTVAAVRAAGYLVTDLDRFTMRLAAPIVSSAVQGTARKQVAA
jgi:SAM-dependent methyltransferase